MKQIQMAVVLPDVREGWEVVTRGGFDFDGEKETGIGRAWRLSHPPGPLAPIEDWLEYRRGLDRLESELRVSHPDLSWLDEVQLLKVEADAAIGALTLSAQPEAASGLSEPGCLAVGAASPYEDRKFLPGRRPHVTDGSAIVCHVNVA